MKNLSTNEKVAIGVSVVVVGFFFIFGGLVLSIIKTGQFPGSETATSTEAIETTNNMPKVTIQDITVGSGDTAEEGNTVVVNYVGMFTDGKVFDSSVARKEPFTFTLGAGQVISGWEQGLQGMKVGGKRVIVVPPQLGYGDKDYSIIPANSTLVFQIELLSVSK
jgi:FKBP-type peptidyl-prolyl cis-trans isomerase